MATANGYVSLDVLRALRRLEADVQIEGLGMFRVQALTQEDVRLVGQAAKDDGNLWRQHQVVRGLIRPDLAALAADDLDEAVAVVKALHPMVVDALDRKINELTFMAPSDAYRDLASKNGCAEPEAATPSGSSN